MVDKELLAKSLADIGLRNLIAHRYATIAWKQIHAIASRELEDLLQFCAQLAHKADEAR